MKQQKQGLVNNIFFKLWFNRLKLVKPVYIAALIFGAAILFYACENDIEEIKALAISEERPYAEIKNIYTKSTESGKLSYTLKAPLVYQYKIEGKEFTEFPEGLELKKFNENGDLVSSIKADFAKQNVLEDKWEAKINVIATNLNGDTLKTEHLIYDREKGNIHTDEFVTIISADKIMYGDGLTSDEQMQSWEIENPKGIIYITVDEGQPQ